MISNLVDLYLTSPLQVLLNELEELDKVAAFDLAHASGDSGGFFRRGDRRS